jgi:hypothetical protein
MENCSFISSRSLDLLIEALSTVQLNIGFNHNYVLCNIPLHGYLPKMKGNLIQYEMKIIKAHAQRPNLQMEIGT